MRRIVVMMLAGALMFTGCLGSGDTQEDISFNGLEYNPPVQAPDFTLTDQDGNPVSLSEFDGKVMVVAFTYTHCPDVCPVIEANMKYMQGELGESYNEDVAYLSISIDPLRDTPEVLAQYVEENGFEWPHLTSYDYEMLKEVWNGWGVAVNSSMIDDHVNGAMNMTDEGVIHSMITMMPDNSTSEYEVNSTHLPENATGWNLTTMGFNMNNVSLNSSTHAQYGNQVHGINGVDSPSDYSWWWSLYVWNSTNSSWEESQVGVDGISISNDQTHIAWVASNSNISNLPTPASEICGGHGSIMGEGGGAHCMCEDGYKRDGNNQLTCIPEDEEGANENTGEAEDEYNVGHSTVTFILDREGYKRVAWVGSDWNADEFLEDIQALI
ncbi:MAG: SCO family protein [Euryarchaeota archaeon]|jgi:cytochrome oxidase Cu insertion factor (SCO1/SenC/PrrC family)|nr:SCO family protein [Euryarchaeota archaeon]